VISNIISRSISGSIKEGMGIILNEISRQKLNHMRYKTFTFPNNPATCRYSCEKMLVRHKYPELAAVELEDMDVDAAVISCQGEFFGREAYNQWRELNRIFREGGVGDFYHPVYTDVTKGIMSKLESDMEPRQDYISYTFEIIQHIPAMWNGKPATAIQQPDRLSVGSIVIANGNAYASSGSGAKIKTILSNKETTITNYLVGAKYPVHVGTYGWMLASDVKLKNSAQVSTIIYTVKSGDTLSKIASKYNITWQSIAKLNNLKNPSLILPGQKLKIK